MASAQLEKVVLAKPRGFCAGVVRAIDIVEMALKIWNKAPVYVRKEIIHNRHVVNELREKGAIFIDEIEEVPEGSLLIFSAHGVSPQVRKAAASKKLRVLDATCPLVTKVHLEAIRYAKQGYTIVLIGHKDHDEVIGTLGEAPESIRVVGTVEEVDRLQVPNPDRVAYVTQTTLSIDDTKAVVEALNKKFPQLVGPQKDDICYATQNRQHSVKEMAEQVDLILVLGAPNSSNSVRLKEVSQASGTRAYLIQDADDIQAEWFEGIKRVGITAGASAPEVLVERVLDYCRRLGDPQIEEFEAVKEDVKFSLPIELERMASAPER
jgi:4-hydroxy-3-methylbut-2-enyl diphosphate reductase